MLSEVPGISLLIVDTHVGISEDLACFLSSQIHLSDNQSDESNQVLLVPNALDDQDGLSIHLPCRLRVVMFSAQSPVFYGNYCHPLPLCCMKHVTVLYWGSSRHQSTHYIDPKPIHSALDR